jgi:GWxTD domain-containing protein
MVKSAALFLFYIPFLALSQERMPGKEPQNRPSLVTFEAVQLFGPDSSKLNVNIHYRIPRGFFVFVRPSDPAAPKDEFTARGQLQVELFTEQDVSVAREIRPMALTRTSLPQADEQQGDIEGAIAFTLAGGQYRIVFEVDDLESGRSFLDKKQSVKTQLLSPKSLVLSDPIFAAIDSTRTDGIRYLPFNHGSNVVYGNLHGGMICQVYCPQSDSALEVHWKLHGEAENQSQQIKDLNGKQFDLVAGLLNLATKEGPVAYQALISGPTWKILFVPVPLELLEPGQYKLELNATDGKDQFKHEASFRVVWPNRPMSLMDWDISTDALRYIAKPEEMEKIVSSSSEKGLEEFRSFWRKRDPDTTTAYNQIMVEYYRRVDEAIRQFSTVKELDGYKTDRGRIYILNGPPTNVERSVLPGQPLRELWTYDNIKKQFVFTEKNKSGNYILTQTSNF